MIKRYIQISFQHEGIHYWPGAIDLEDVSYLASPHRHIFHIKVKVSVEHNDREIEFIMFKHEIEHMFKKAYTSNLGTNSCEDLAEAIIDYVKFKYPKRTITVEVFEDNENGAILEYVE